MGRLLPRSQSRSEAGCLGGSCALSNVPKDRAARPRVFGRFMRFTSLIVELIRARPRLVVWIVVLAQAALWFLVSLLFYRSPPGDLATVLPFDRESQVGPNLGPPLAFWLAD